jgi:hypothetical protein
MAKSGDELVNPVTGLRTVLRKTAQETSGDRDSGGAGARREDQQSGGTQEPTAVGAHPARVRGGDLFRPTSAGRSEGDPRGAGKGRAATRVSSRIPLPLRQAKPRGK